MDQSLLKKPPVRLTDVGRVFDGRRVLNNINLIIQPGEFVVLVGKSGCGKSTLLRIINELDADAEGMSEVVASRAIVFQDPRLLPWKLVWKNVVLGTNGPSAELRTKAHDALKEVDLVARSDAWPLTLSGGEAQRTALARALVRTPDLLLLDEPFAALDALTRLKMQHQILELWRHHRIAMLFVTHDVDEALQLADRVLLMEAGEIIREFEIDIPRPRHRDHPRFAHFRRELLLSLGVKEAE